MLIIESNVVVMQACTYLGLLPETNDRDNGTLVVTLSEDISK